MLGAYFFKKYISHSIIVYFCIMKRVIMTGATGMIGGIILRECINSSEIESIKSIVRKPSGITHPKLTEVVHTDFVDYSNVEDYFKDIDIAYFCIGVYTGQFPDEQFKIITVDYTKAFADALKKHSSNAVFCFLSGEGADLKEKSRMSFARYKGMAENYLMSKRFKQFYTFRPSYIYPVEKRVEPNFSYRLMRRLYPLMKAIAPSAVITSEQLGTAMFRAGINGAPKTILENEDIKKIP